jgi:hypothetical protein
MSDIISERKSVYCDAVYSYFSTILNSSVVSTNKIKKCAIIFVPTDFSFIQCKAYDKLTNSGYTVTIKPVDITCEENKKLKSEQAVVHIPTNKY